MDFNPNCRVLRILKNVDESTGAINKEYIYMMKYELIGAQSEEYVLSFEERRRTSYN